MVAGVPVCPEGSLDHSYGVEVGLRHVLPWPDEEERLRAEW